MADTPKAPPPPPQPIDPGTTFIKNPGGVVHDLEPTHPAIELAKKGESGWRLASDEEIRDYCERHNLIPPADSKADAGAAPAAPKAKAAAKKA